MLAQVIGISAVVLFVVWVMWRVLFRPKLITYLRMRKLPRRTVATLVPGERAWLVGVARARTLGPAIMSGRPCILSSIRENLRSGRSDATARGEDFELEDATGRVLVCGRGAYEADLVEDWVGSLDFPRRDASFGKGVLAREGATLYRNDIAPEQSEGLVVDGMRVAVGGTVERGDDGTLRLVGTRDLPLYVVDVLCHLTLPAE